MAKVAMIGAGSVEFTRQLTIDILSYPELGDTHFALVDIDPERLATAETLVSRLIAQLRGESAGPTAGGGPGAVSGGAFARPGDRPSTRRAASATVSAHSDRREALAGADYVICMIQVGGLPATLIDFNVPAKYGLRQTIADTLGVGGVFRALRTVPAVVAIARDMENLCPNAPLLNYANPMAMVVLAVSRATSIKAVGLCHSVQGTSRHLARFAGAPFGEVEFFGAGINHQNWILRLTHRGRDLYPALWEAMRDPVVYAQDKVRWEIMRRVGYFPTESSEHSAEYVPWFMKSEAEIARLDIPVGEYIHRSEASLGEHAEMASALARGDRLDTERSYEYAAHIIWCAETGTDGSFYGNVPNAGLIGNLPAGACVEVPCLVNRAGIQPCHVGDLPPQCAAINQTNINVQQLAVDAALSGDRDRVYQAVMVDPNASATLTLDQIWTMVDEMIRAHGGRIPELKSHRLRS